MKKVVFPLLGILVSAALGAQTLQTAYFSDDYTYSYRFNPAFHPDYSFVGIPVAGLTTAAYKGNFALNDIFYKNGGERVTFGNESVSSAEFLDNFKSGLNKVSLESYTNLAAIGFRAGGLYNIVDVNVRSFASGKLPYDLARFLKEGAETDGTYDLSGLKAHASTFFEMGITSSWRVRRKLIMGMRFKAVIGFANSYIDMDRMVINHTGDSWNVSSSGVIASAYDGYQISSAAAYYDPAVDLIDFRGTRIGKPRGIMNGYGVGADMGLLYDDSSWQLSASISDIGCVFWFHNLYGHAPSSDKTYTATYTRHHGGDALENEFSDMGALLGDAANFIEEDEYQSLGLLPLTARIGAKYLSLSDISFGGVATFRYDDICPFWDVRGSVNYKPVKTVELIGSLGLGSLGVSMGAFANARLGFINIFAGTDNLIGTSGSTFLRSTTGSPNFIAGLNIIW